MESVERHLGGWLTDGLSSDDTNSFSGLDNRLEVLSVECKFEGLAGDGVGSIDLLLLTGDQLVGVVVNVLWLCQQPSIFLSTVFLTFFFAW